MTFARVCQNPLVDRVEWKGCDNVGQLTCCGRGESVLGKSGPHEKEGDLRWRGGQRDWRGWRRRANGQQRWVNK